MKLTNRLRNLAESARLLRLGDFAAELDAVAHRIGKDVIEWEEDGTVYRRSEWFSDEEVRIVSLREDPLREDPELTKSRFDQLERWYYELASSLNEQRGRLGKLEERVRELEAAPRAERTDP
jgi:hypothetical protein